MFGRDEEWVNPFGDGRKATACRLLRPLFDGGLVGDSLPTIRSYCPASNTPFARGKTPFFFAGARQLASQAFQTTPSIGLREAA